MFRGTAIDVTGGTDNAYNITDPSELTGGSGFEVTTLQWLNLDTLGNNRRFFRRDGAFDATLPFSDNNNIAFEVGRVTTWALAISDTDWLGTGSWQFMACTYSESDGPRIFHGTPSAACIEVTSYGTRTVGVGNTLSFSGNDLELFGRGAVSAGTHDGRFAYSQLIGRRLELGEIIQLQFQPGIAVTDTATIHFPGIGNDVTTLTDFSGNGNDAARQGSGQAIATADFSLGHWGGGEPSFTTVVAGGAGMDSKAKRFAMVNFGDGTNIHLLPDPV